MTLNRVGALGLRPGFYFSKSGMQSYFAALSGDSHECYENRRPDG